MKSMLVRFAGVSVIALAGLGSLPTHAYDPPHQKDGPTASQSEQIFEREPQAKSGSPNVVFIVLNDGACSGFDLA